MSVFGSPEAVRRWRAVSEKRALEGEMKECRRQTLIAQESL